jgi:hypothetical protein
VRRDKRVQWALFAASALMAAYVVGGTTWLWWTLGYDGEMVAIAAVTSVALYIQWEVARGS